MSNTATNWQRYCQYRVSHPDLGLSLDISRVRFESADIEPLLPKMADALLAMQKLESGSIANADENRMVGHYWLRKAELAPEAELTAAIAATQTSITHFAQRIHSGQLAGSAGPFQHLVVIGIGGSALGPQFVAAALGTTNDAMQVHFIDNTDPAGIDDVLASLQGELGRTLCLVVSKSGGTPETRNGMLEFQQAFENVGLPFHRHAVAITQFGSKLHAIAEEEKWIDSFPMWDWVGGRTSVMSAVGLLPMALQGLETQPYLDGAALMDEWTREVDPLKNPAALLAMMWYHCTGGKGLKDMVVLPYKDRLLLLSRYLQQLVMESLGKEFDRQGNLVEQGIAVYGNKGSTDQHAYVQQLREGVPNFFMTFIQVLQDRAGTSIEVDPGITSGDYLTGFLLGTRDALSEKNRDSLTITLQSITPASVGALIALYERAVGLYAELVDINAYHQPGVEAGKKAAAGILGLQSKVVEYLQNQPTFVTAEDVATGIGEPERCEAIYQLLQHLAANPGRGIAAQLTGRPATDRFKGDEAQA